MDDPISGGRARPGGSAESDDEGGARRGVVRGALLAAMGAAVIAGSGPAAAWTGDPPDPVVVPVAQDPSPEGYPEPEEGAPALAVEAAVPEAEDGAEEGLEAVGEESAEAAAPKGVEAAVAYAVAHIGDPYALGGRGPHRWDCSGLVQEAYRRAGVRLPRIAADQYRATVRIPRSALRRGDLVFWSSDGRASGVHHVAIYLGGGRYLEAARPGTKVRISAFSRYSPNLYGRARPPAGR
ncbi:C40 family peptidase [Streptomyces sp. AV19]|uniref:C40 family peptidase n=1 Tax=Streptomyces sp. AV19 TaxID=2793068 RepID=UPI0018FEE9E0|nr:C40 family peptidase [Streptomyces sp. AV19]MBH1932889.1 C40 family peptidase [Streptomyces sp. AV19]MDG4531567.1 C40 family peptidase [Streptomyces sp. AV19]